MSGERFATRAVHAGLEPDPSYGGVVPAIHQASTYVQRAPGEFVEDSDAAVPADLVRLSCGIEDAADLVEDLAQAIGAPVPAGA